ncbi:hypothetical protein MKW98_007655 [Papaver atlanticum]|uniref:Uncharacterized protein n=1 Tax=Papaver atlanticum TaxID=357466 RepID=A0AAD4X8E2_9MAGN|nr:hypothetical protein MKW98_007655 [Papaver atlanticum]
MSLKCVIQLGIPDIIHNHGKPITPYHLADALSIPSTKRDSLNRLMRFMIHSGFFLTKRHDENQEEEGYVLTPTSRLLVKENANTLSSIVLAMSSQNFPYFMCGNTPPLHFLSDWFQGSGNTPCEAAHGRSVWDVLAQNHEFGKTVNDAIANDSHLLMNVIVNEGQGVFKNLKSLVDVGGGTGATTQAIVEVFPHMKCMVLELPHVVSSFSRTNNIDFISGDMFKSIPHADAVLMKAIPSREEGGKVIIIDAVIEEDNTEQEHDSITETQLLIDMMMMAIVGGKERSEKEWENLFLEAGFCDYKITPVSGFRSLIEVYP